MTDFTSYVQKVTNPSAMPGFTHLCSEAGIARWNQLVTDYVKGCIPDQPETVKERVLREFRGTEIGQRIGGLASRGLRAAAEKAMLDPKRDIQITLVL